MIKNNQIQEFLKEYSPDVEVIIHGSGEIKHIGMVNPKEDKKHKIILASEKPLYQCEECGENVYKVPFASMTFRCYRCNSLKDSNEVSRIK